MQCQDESGRARLAKYGRGQAALRLGGSGYFTPDSRLFRIYISLSALLTVPNGIIGLGVLIAVDAAGFFAWCFAAKAADVDRPRTARLTIRVLCMSNSSLDREQERGSASALLVFGIDTSPPPAPAYNIIASVAFQPEFFEGNGHGIHFSLGC